MSRIIAAIREKKAFQEALQSKVHIIFDLSPSIENIREKAASCHKNGKLLFAHMDLAEGIAKDSAGLRFVKLCGVDGIISTRAQLIKGASELGLKTVQRIFILDSQSVDTAVSMLKCSPDMAEFMPGIVPSKVIDRLKMRLDIPLIAGGFIETESEVEAAIATGATAVSTSRVELWNL